MSCAAARSGRDCNHRRLCRPSATKARRLLTGRGPSRSSPRPRRSTRAWTRTSTQRRKCARSWTVADSARIARALSRRPSSSAHAKSALLAGGRRRCAACRCTSNRRTPSAISTRRQPGAPRRRPAGLDVLDRRRYRRVRQRAPLPERRPAAAAGRGARRGDDQLLRLSLCAAGEPRRAVPRGHGSWRRRPGIRRRCS